MTVKLGFNSRKGFSLIELIAAMVLVGVAAAVVGVSFMSFNRPGITSDTLQDAVDLQKLAEHRLKLILAEKLEDGFPEKHAGPDPCLLYLKDEDLCNDSVKVVFTPDKDNYCNTENTTFKYCDVKVSYTVDSVKSDFFMRLYNYD
jgi:prepilin-type N-terminal cleavage/methylation domain-containing protein